MQNSTQTSSSFYMHMRQAYAATPPPPPGRTSISDTSSFSYAPHTHSHVDASFNGSSYLSQPNRYNAMPQEYMLPPPQQQQQQQMQQQQYPYPQPQQQQIQYMQQPALGNGYMGDRRDQVSYDVPPPADWKRNDPYSISPSSTVDTGIPVRTTGEYPVPPTRLGSPSTFEGQSEYGGRISNIRQRLAEIQSRGSGNSPQRDANRSPSHPSHHQDRQRSRRHRSSSQGHRHSQRSHSRHHHHQRDVSQDSGIVSPSPSSSARSSPARDVQHRHASIAEVEMSDDAFTAREMTYFRVIELTAPVLLLAELTPGCGALTELCDSARIKVFPKHVVFVKPDGDPVVELVISELCNLDEDGERQFVDFIVKPKKIDKEQVIRAVCYDTTARGILYKLVSCRRDAIENARSTSTAPQSIPR